jgi:hypothetical protein
VGMDVEWEHGANDQQINVTVNRLWRKTVGRLRSASPDPRLRLEHAPGEPEVVAVDDRRQSLAG